MLSISEYIANKLANCVNLFRWLVAFLWFLNNNGILYREDGSKRLADNTLVALTLMIAESKPDEKDVMVKVVVNLINQKN